MGRYQIQIEQRDGTTLTVDDVEEFAAGYLYLFLRTGAETLSIRRTEIVRATRRRSVNSEWEPIVLRKARW